MSQVQSSFILLLLSATSWIDCFIVFDGHPTGNDCDYLELRPSPRSCATYLQCNYPTEYEMPCPKMDQRFGLQDNILHFSFVKQTCDWPELVQCHLIEFPTLEPNKTTTLAASTGEAEVPLITVPTDETTESATTIVVTEEDKTTLETGEETTIPTTLTTTITTCLLYTSPSPRDRQKSRMPSSA